MIELPLLFARVNDMWYALPLIVAVSFVYSATRFEPMEDILRHAGRVGLWIAGFMAAILLVLWGVPALLM